MDLWLTTCHAFSVNSVELISPIGLRGLSSPFDFVMSLLLVGHVAYEKQYAYAYENYYEYPVYYFPQNVGHSY